MPSPPFRAVLFDLDGTLLRVEMASFIGRYVAAFHACCSDLFAYPELQRAMRAGIHLLLETEDGERSNEARLFAFLAGRLQQDEAELRQRFALFLASDFQSLADTVLPIPEAARVLALCRKAEIPLVLATNPVFPRALVEARCRWGGIEVGDFALLTSFENSRYCKPQPGYFGEIAARLGIEPEECLMVGNDTSHDLSATRAGMTTWLVDSYLHERSGPVWEADHRGDHRQLFNYLCLNLDC